MANGRVLYESENGDSWHLVRDVDTGQAFVRHLANAPSGGASTDIALPMFLITGAGPQQQALWRLIDQLTEPGLAPRDAHPDSP